LSSYCTRVLAYGCRRSINACKYSSDDSKRYNPTSQNRQGGKTSRASARKAAAKQGALNESKQEAPRDSKQSGGKNNVSAAKYVLIQSFVRGVLQHCIKKEQYNSTCVVDVAKDVGISSAFALAFSYIPGATALPFILTLKTSCIDTSPSQHSLPPTTLEPALLYSQPRNEKIVECTQAFVKFGASVVTTMASYSLGLGVFGPIIDGVAQHFVSEAIDYGADYIMSVAFPEE
jgi:hypothetical protein